LVRIYDIYGKTPMQFFLQTDAIASLADKKNLNVVDDRMDYKEFYCSARSLRSSSLLTSFLPSPPSSPEPSTYQKSASTVLKFELTMEQKRMLTDRILTLLKNFAVDVSQEVLPILLAEQEIQEAVLKETTKFLNEVKRIEIAR
jgi:hypothetical protein